MKKFGGLASVLALTALLVAGCGTGTDDAGSPGDPQVNMKEAAQSADELILHTFQAVKPPLEWTHDTSDHGSCNGKDSGVGNVVRRAVVMTKVSPARRGALLGVIERYWKNQGYKITDVNPHRDFPEMYAENQDALLRTSLIVGGEGQFFIEVETACVTTSEVPDPPAEQANGTSYYGQQVPRPNVESDFWSSDTPIKSSALPSPTQP
jgi:hypothetical protein